MDGVKKCSYCMRVKALRHFYAQPNGDMGVGNRCRQCTSDANRKMRRARHDMAKIRTYVKQAHEIMTKINDILDQEGGA